MTPKPASERDREMADGFLTNRVPRPRTMTAQQHLAQLLAQAREEGRLEGIEQAVADLQHLVDTCPASQDLAGCLAGLKWSIIRIRALAKDKP